jgi:hypothetical protein
MRRCYDFALQLCVDGMNTLAGPDLHIHRITDIVPSTEGRLVIKAGAVVSSQRTELEIAVTADLAPAMAVALLATTARARAARDGTEPALDVLGAAVVPLGNEEKVRIQLLFDKRVVLPLEMNVSAWRALAESLEGSMRSLAQGSNSSMSKLDD